MSRVGTLARIPPPMDIGLLFVQVWSFQSAWKESKDHKIHYPGLLASSSGHRSESFVCDGRNDFYRIMLIILSISVIVLVFVFRF
jgi:hypothetical protein